MDDDDLRYAHETLLRKRQIVALLETRLGDARGWGPKPDLAGPTYGQHGPWDADERPVAAAIARNEGVILHLERNILAL